MFYHFPYFSIKPLPCFGSHGTPTPDPRHPRHPRSTRAPQRRSVRRRRPPSRGRYRRPAAGDRFLAAGGLRGKFCTGENHRLFNLKSEIRKQIGIKKQMGNTDGKKNMKHGSNWGIKMEKHGNQHWDPTHDDIFSMS